MSEDNSISSTVEQSPSTETLIKQTDVLTVCGRRGSGKSNLTKTLIKFLVNSRCPVMVVDPLQEHREFDRLGVINKYIPYGDQQGFDDFLQTIIGKWKGMLVIDEADGYFPNRKNLLPYQKTLIHLGRHYGLGMLFVTRRLSNLHTDVISQTSKLFSFRLFAGADANYLSLMQLEELIEPIWNLEKYSYVFYDSEQGEINVCPPLPKFSI